MCPRVYHNDGSTFDVQRSASVDARSDRYSGEVTDSKRLQRFAGHEEKGRGGQDVLRPSCDHADTLSPQLVVEFKMTLENFQGETFHTICLENLPLQVQRKYKVSIRPFLSRCIQLYSDVSVEIINQSLFQCNELLYHLLMELL